MKKNAKTLLAGLLAASLMGAGSAVAHSVGNQGQAMPMYPQMGPGQMTMPGMMGPGMMMAPGMPGANGFPCANQVADKDLTANDVRSILDGHLQRMGHARLTVGDVTKTDDDYLAEVTTKEGSLVWRLKLDAKTGTMHHVSE